MKKNKGFLFAVVPAILGLAALISGAVLQQTAGELFEKALYVEEGQGDLQKAIGLYQDIVKRFPAEREAAAKALLHIGMCYEKLGKSEARNAYSRLLQDYSDQAQPVKEARSRLAKLAAVEEGRIPEKAGLVFRKLDFPGSGATPQIRLSPDGSKVLYIGIQEAEPRYSIRLFDFASGKSKTLVEGIDGNYWTHIFCWSPDGNRVVYLARRGELRMINPEGGKPVSFWTAPDKETEVFPLDWSGRNHSILVSILDQSQHKAHLSILPENGGEPRTIVSGDIAELEYWAQFSPDGKFIVGRKTKDKNNDVYVWEVDGGAEINVTDHPANDTYPYWSPDGKYIVYISDRAGTVDLWAVPMAGPRPAGNPIRIQANIGKNKAPTDFTKSGQLVFNGAEDSSINPADLFVLPVDPKTGEAQGSLHPFGKYPLGGLGVYRWSPDGQRVAYTSRKGNLQLPSAFISTGGANEDLEIPANGYWMGNVEWSRDGKSLLFPGYLVNENQVGIFRISLEMPTVEPVHMSGERLGAKWKGSYWSLRWLPLAGKYVFHKSVSESEQEIYFLDPSDYKIQRAGAWSGNINYEVPSPDGRYMAELEAKTRNFVLLSLADGVSKVISTLPASQELGYPFSWSPDGKKIVWIEGRQLKVMTVPDETPQTLYEAAQSKKIGGGLSATPNTAWSPDGSKIAFVLKDAAPDSKALPELWIVAVAGGSARKIADAPSSHPLVVGVVWHPSGKMIFAQGFDPKIMKEGNEHWVMENFLPAPQAALEKGAGELQVRKVWDKALDSFFMGAPSPDGKHLTYVDWEKFANLGVHNLVTGENRLLTDIKTWEGGEMCYGSAFSPDGSRIAFSFQTQDMLNQLRIVHLDGSSMKVLHDGSDVSFQGPVGWTPDGKQILTLSFAKNETTKLAFVSAVDGSVKDVKVLSVRLTRTTSMSLSPDGKYVACTYLPRKDSDSGDILLLNTAGGAESKLIVHPADDRVLGWSPDGRRVFFTSDRTGTVGVWAVTVAEGKAKGTPELVRGNIGNIRHLGMTREGKLYYGIYTGWSDIFVASIDPATGKVTGQPEKVIRKYETFNSAPDWSPDGQSLVCRSSQGKMASETPALLICSPRTGEVREVNPKISGGLNVHYIRWTADGRSVLAVGLDEKGKYGALVAIDAGSGEVKIIARPDSDRVIYYPDCAADGNSIYFIRSGQPNKLIRLDLESGIEKELLSSSQPLGYFRFALSRDGQKMVVFDGDKIRIHASDGTEARELIKVKDVNTMAWTADGKNILYGKLQEGSQEVVDLWGIPAAGGEPQKLGLTMSLLMHLRVSPDGKNIAFTASEQPGKAEVWVMENFLPKEK